MATFTVSGTVEPVGWPSNPLGNTDDVTWALAVPVGAPVSLSVARHDFTQTLDLRAGRRTTPSPAVLYRPGADPDLAVTPTGTQDLIATSKHRCDRQLPGERR
ncbi:MAG: hypothetical protein ACRDY0_02685 [Acidimicrobiales bacterium]